MRKIAIINQKGGVAKTTTAVNLAAGLSRQGKRVLLVDMDAQGGVRTSFNCDDQPDMHDILVEGVSALEAIRPLGKNLDVITSKETLTRTELILTNESDRETMLKRRFEHIKGYDYVIIDCPPSLGILTQNVLLYADEAFVPVSMDFLGIEGLTRIANAIVKINKVFDHKIRMTKIVPTMFDRRNKICRKSLDLIRSEYYEIVSEPIRIDTKIREAPGHGKSIFSYAKSSRGAKDYSKLVQSVINDEAQIEKMAAMEETARQALAAEAR
jgi:chromosome partitioning protein